MNIEISNITSDLKLYFSDYSEHFHLFTQITGINCTIILLRYVI